jgi:predicted P-loop ATPase
MSPEIEPSSRTNPCPICSRTKNGHCRRTPQGWLCHHGKTHHPPECRPGQVVVGHDGHRWAYAGPTSDGRTSAFKPDTPRSGAGQRVLPHPVKTTGAVAAAITLPETAADITLARLPEPATQPPAHWPVGQELPYGATQKVVVGAGKQFYPHHRLADGTWAKGAGPDPWPLWHEAEALQCGPGHWVMEDEGEKCCEWLRAGAVVAISQPGPAHTLEAIKGRYERLQQAGVLGVVYVADHDQAGQQKATKCQQAAAAVGLSFLAIPAATIWPDLPSGGSVDDAPGTAAERVAAIEQAIPAALQQAQQAAEQQAAEQQCDAAPLGRSTQGRITKADLQAFLQIHYRLEFNELTRNCEIDGAPMGSRLHLADSFLAHQHGIEVPKQAAADSFEFVAKSNPYNPVRRYLLGLRDRTDLQLISMNDLGRAFGIHPTDTVSQRLLAAHLAGCVHRGISPGYKHDQLLVLTGPQGNLKSSSIEALAPSGWYDSATRVADLESKDTLAKINSAWLFEFDECEHTLQRSTASEFKGFITRRNDNYVEKYEKQSTPHDRRAVLFGTTNQTEFLNDNTGNRRVWIIDTEGRPLDPDWIAANRDSIWGTVLTWIDWGLKNWLPQTDELAIAAAARAEQANLSDPWEGAIAAVLEKRPVGITGGIGQDELVEQALHLSADKITRDVQMRVTRIVTGSAFLTHDDTVRWEQQKRRYGSGKPRSGYIPVRPRPGQAAAAAPFPDPTDPTDPTSKAVVPTDLEGVVTAETPWLDRRLTILFQSVPTFFLSGNGVIGEGPAGGHGGGGGAIPFPGREIGTGRNGPEIPSAAVDLADPMGLAHAGGWNGTPPSGVGSAATSCLGEPRTSEHQPATTADRPVPTPGDAIEVRNGLGSWGPASVRKADAATGWVDITTAAGHGLTLKTTSSEWRWPTVES